MKTRPFPRWNGLFLLVLPVLFSFGWVREVKPVVGCGNSCFCKNATRLCRTATPIISTPPFIGVPLQFNFIKINS